MTAAERIAALGARWRRRRMAGYALLAAAAGLALGFGGAAALGAGLTLQAVTAGAGLLVGLAGSVVAARRHPVSNQAVARQLNREVPALEESAQLLLDPLDRLSPLARLQRTRAESAIRALTAEPTLPHRPWRRSVQAAGLLLALGAAVRLGGTFVRHAGSRSATPATVAIPAVPPPRSSEVAITVRPPAYTGRAPHRTDRWDLEAEAGSQVTWRVRWTQPPDAAFLVTNRGDTLPLTADSTRRWRTAGRRAEQPLVYQVLARWGDTVLSSDYYRLGVIADAPPTVAVVTPAERTLLPPDSLPAVPVMVHADDDYGIARPRLLATLTTGSGEAVKFRAESLPLQPAGRWGAHGGAFRATIDLRALGLGPGDELYFSVSVEDRQTPRPNQSRSATIFLGIADTAAPPRADFAGLGGSALPEYFRSERQIIIDTEKLLADQPGLDRTTFRNRSNNIGIDQGLLRARYGQFVGDETEGGEPAAAPDSDQRAGYIHQHDTEENATLLAPAVKAKLKAALAEMWEAERRLRTAEPRAALPYENRALRLIKEIQQDARVYVQRVGFEPPPLQPDRTRLTGDLAGVADPRSSRAEARPPRFPAIREAVGVLAQLPARPATPRDRAALEAAGRELAPIAVNQPDQLTTLRALRRLIDSMGDGYCGSCAVQVERGFWRALPSPPPLPAPKERGSPVLGRRYFEALEGRR